METLSCCNAPIRREPADVDFYQLILLLHTKGQALHKNGKLLSRCETETKDTEFTYRESTKGLDWCGLNLWTAVVLLLNSQWIAGTNVTRFHAIALMVFYTFCQLAHSSTTVIIQIRLQISCWTFMKRSQVGVLSSGESISCSTFFVCSSYRLILFCGINMIFQYYLSRFYTDLYLCVFYEHLARQNFQQTQTMSRTFCGYAKSSQLFLFCYRRYNNYRPDAWNNLRCCPTPIAQKMRTRSPRRAPT